MNANLDPNESRVFLEMIEDLAAGREYDLEKSDVPFLLSATSKVTLSTLSRADAHRTHLIHQGVHPHIAEAHVRHRFGV